MIDIKSAIKHAYEVASDTIDAGFTNTGNAMLEYLEREYHLKEWARSNEQPKAVTSATPGCRLHAVARQHHNPGCNKQHASAVL